METPGPPVDGGAINDGGQDGVFVCEGGGEGPWFVSMRDLEDQTLMTAVVVVVDLVPVVLKEGLNGLERIRIIASGKRKGQKKTDGQSTILVDSISLNAEKIKLDKFYPFFHTFTFRSMKKLP